MSKCSYKNVQIQEKGGKLQAVVLDSSTADFKDRSGQYLKGMKNLLAIEKMEDYYVEGGESFVGELGENQEMLDDYRISKARKPREVGRYLSDVMRNLLYLLALVEEGKMYDIALNPLNFVRSRDKGTVAGFVRKAVVLKEVNNEWIYDVKKLIAYYFNTDEDIRAEDYEDYTIQLLVKNLDMSLQEKYFELTGDVISVKDMYFALIRNGEEETPAMKAFNNYPAYVKHAKKPLNIVDFDNSEELYEMEDSNEDGSEYEEYEEELPDEDESVSNKKKKKDKKKRNKGKLKEEEFGDSFDRPVKKRGVSGFVVFMLIILFSGVSFFGGKIVTERLGTKTDEEKIYPEMYKGMIDGTLQKYSDAMDKFDDFLSSKENGKDKLSDEEKNAIFFTYLLAGAYDKASKFDETNTGAETIVKFLHAKDDGSGKGVETELKNITSNATPFEMERAIYSKDYDKVASLRDKVDVDDSKFRQSAIVEALVKTGQLDEAINFANTVGDVEIMKAIKAWGVEYIDGQNMDAKEKDSKKKELEVKVDDAVKGMGG